MMNLRILNCLCLLILICISCNKKFTIPTKFAEFNENRYNRESYKDEGLTYLETEGIYLCGIVSADTVVESLPIKWYKSIDTSIENSDLAIFKKFYYIIFLEGCKVIYYSPFTRRQTIDFELDIAKNSSELLKGFYYKKESRSFTGSEPSNELVLDLINNQGENIKIGVSYTLFGNSNKIRSLQFKEFGKIELNNNSLATIPVYSTFDNLFGLDFNFYFLHKEDIKGLNKNDKLYSIKGVPKPPKNKEERKWKY
jgi:hypothetical protein